MGTSAHGTSNLFFLRIRPERLTVAGSGSLASTTSMLAAWLRYPLVDLFEIAAVGGVCVVRDDSGGAGGGEGTLCVLACCNGDAGGSTGYGGGMM